MNLLPAPGHTSFRLPHSTLFYIPTRCPWTLDDTLNLRRTEAEISREWANECHWQEWLSRQSQKFCTTPHRIYGAAPADGTNGIGGSNRVNQNQTREAMGPTDGTVVQMRLFEECVA